VPHLIVNIERKFRQSSVLDTSQRFSARLTSAGTYHYFCSLHPMMQGVVTVV
jgi:plastocyanin